MIEPEHLLGGLVRLGAESPVGEVIATLDLDLDDIRRTYPERRDTRPAGSVRPAQSRVGRFSRRTASVLEHAFRHAYFRSQKKLTPVHVLLAMLSVSPEVFEALGIDLGEREDATLSLWSEFGPRIKRELAQTVATVRVAPPNVRVGPSGPVLSRRRDRPAKDIRGLLAEIVTRLEAIERRLDQA